MTATRQLVKVLVEWDGCASVLLDAPADMPLTSVRDLVRDNLSDFELEPVMHFHAIAVDDPGDAEYVDIINDKGWFDCVKTAKWRERTDSGEAMPDLPPQPIPGQIDIFGGEVA